MTRDELNELREAWRDAVVTNHFRLDKAPKPCWFSLGYQEIFVKGYVDYGPCEGRIIGAHWIKRRRVERTIANNLGVPMRELAWMKHSRLPFPSRSLWAVELELIALAAWDPRNGVPACVRHDDKMDGHQVDARNEFIVWRHQVPQHVIDFANDWGLETALDDRNPTMTGGI